MLTVASPMADDTTDLMMGLDVTLLTTDVTASFTAVGMGFKAFVAPESLVVIWVITVTSSTSGEVPSRPNESHRPKNVL